MRRRRKSCQGAGIGGIWLLVSLAAGCQNSSGANLSMEIRFATQIQGLEEDSGLPIAVHSLKVSAFGVDQNVAIGDTGCIDLSSDSRERRSIELDLTPSTNLLIQALGYAQYGCTGNAQWMGQTGGVVVREGEEIQVPIFVTWRGLHLNATRNQLPSKRAFATASPLPDGKILIAGGFESALNSAGRVELSAACDATIYDPSRGTFSGPLFMPSCRGLHRAVVVDKGVILVGGVSKAILDLTGSTRPVLRPMPESLDATAVFFDSSTRQFVEIGNTNLLARAEAVVLGSEQTVALFGGRTNQLRSDEMVGGTMGTNGMWSWNLDEEDHLLVPRSGAQGLKLMNNTGVHGDFCEFGILVVGGNDPAKESAEWMLKCTTSSQWTPLALSNVSSLVGHSLLQTGEVEVLTSGGISNDPGALPSDKNVVLSMSGGWGGAWRESSVWRLQHPRAYHVAKTLLDGRMVFAGGLNQQLLGSADIEATTGAGATAIIADTLDVGSVGLAAEMTPDGSILLAGGLKISASEVSISDGAQILSP